MDGSAIRAGILWWSVYRGHLVQWVFPSLTVQLQVIRVVHGGGCGQKGLSHLT